MRPTRSAGRTSPFSHSQQIDHIAFEADDVRAMGERLKSAAARFFADLHDGPYGLTVYLAAPDGTKVELYQVGAMAEG